MLSGPNINRSITLGHGSSSPLSPYRASISDSSFTVIAPEGSYPIWVGVNYELPGVEAAGYYLNRGMPNLSGTIRYQTYRHKKTYGTEEVEAAQIEQMAEYIFVRDDNQ